jgi:uncharacterized protein YjbI with pentapeptide repeats
MFFPFLYLTSKYELRTVQFENCNFHQANFERAIIEGSFRESIFSAANFRSSILFNVDLREQEIDSSGASFSGALFYRQGSKITLPEEGDFSHVLLASSRQDLVTVDLSIYHPVYLEYFLNYVN